MSESPTDGAAATPASIVEPTGQEQQQTPADVSSQEVPKEVQTTPTPPEEKTNEGQSSDDALANFAKSQGFDPDALTDGERKALKIAHDNQKAYRQSTQKSVADTAKDLSGVDEKAQDVESLAKKVQQFEFESKTEKFWKDNSKDRTLEAKMVEILNQKKEQYGKEYAFSLSQDLESLYSLAAGSSLEQARADGARAERDSINAKTAAAATTAHARQTQPQGQVKIDADWIRTKYDSTNPEHRQMVDAFFNKK